MAALNGQQWGVLVTRGLALYAGLQGLSQGAGLAYGAASVTSGAAGPWGGVAVGMGIVQTALLWIAGVALWRSAPRFASRLVEHEPVVLRNTPGEGLEDGSPIQADGADRGGPGIDRRGGGHRRRVVEPDAGTRRAFRALRSDLGRGGTPGTARPHRPPMSSAPANGTAETAPPSADPAWRPVLRACMSDPELHPAPGDIVGLDVTPRVWEECLGGADSRELLPSIAAALHTLDGTDQAEAARSTLSRALQARYSAPHRSVSHAPAERLCPLAYPRAQLLQIDSGFYQAHPPSPFARGMPPVWPLHPTGITPLHRCSGPVRQALAFAALRLLGSCGYHSSLRPVHSLTLPSRAWPVGFASGDLSPAAPSKLRGFDLLPLRDLHPTVP